MPEASPISDAEMLAMIAALHRVVNRLEDAAENVHRGLAPIVMLTPHRDLIPMRAVLDLLKRMP